MVKSGVFIAQGFGISETLIGITIVSIGTSLPELSVAFSSAKKGLYDLLVGNIIGSNIANIALVGGLVGILASPTFSSGEMTYVFPGLLALTLFLIAIQWKRTQVRKFTGLVFVAGYIAFIGIIAFFGV